MGPNCAWYWNSSKVADQTGSLSQSRNYVDITYPADVLSQTSEAQESPSFGLSGEMVEKHLGLFCSLSGILLGQESSKKRVLDFYSGLTSETERGWKAVPLQKIL